MVKSTKGHKKSLRYFANISILIINQWFQMFCSVPTRHFPVEWIAGFVLWMCMKGLFLNILLKAIVLVSLDQLDTI